MSVASALGSRLSIIPKMVDKARWAFLFALEQAGKIHIPRNDEVKSQTNVGWWADLRVHQSTQWLTVKDRFTGAPALNFRGVLSSVSRGTRLQANASDLT
jgi:hypothetical protein